MSSTDTVALTEFTMATNFPAANVSSSPPSGGTRTHHGTPSTIPTIMSPDAGNDDFDNGAGIPKLELARQVV